MEENLCLGKRSTGSDRSARLLNAALRSPGKCLNLKVKGINEIPGVGFRHRACSPSSMGPDGSVPHWADADTDADADANMTPILTGLYYATGQTLHGRQVYQHENWTQSIFYIYGEYDGWMLGPR